MIALLVVTLVVVFGLLPANRDYKQVKGDVNIYVSSNGRHTFFILPVQSQYINWANFFPPEEFPAVPSSPPYISFGWGERAYYIKAEDWSELNLELTLPAAFIPTASAMHVEYFPYKPVGYENLIPLQLTEEQFKFLVNYIYNSVQKNEAGKAVLIPGVTRHNTDRFYEAYGKYHMFNTSNNWTNRALKKMGIRAPLWSPLEGPIMWHLRQVLVLTE